MNVLRDRFNKGIAKRALILVSLFSFPLSVLAAPLEIPPGVGPLPDLQGGAKVGALVTKAHIDKYRSLLPAEVAELVDRGEFAFEAVMRPRTKELFAQGGAATGTPPGLDGSGVLMPPPVSADGPLFTVPTDESGDEDIKARAFRILWNAATQQWRWRSFAGNATLITFTADTHEGRRIDFSFSRIYPPALGQSPGTLKPMFREKVSATNPQVLRGLTWLTLRFLGTVSDYMWAASPITGSVRQITGSNRSDSFFTGAFSPDDLFVWSGKVEGVEPLSIALKPMLVPVVEGVPSAQSTNDGVCMASEYSKVSAIELNSSSRQFAEVPGWVPTNTRMMRRKVWRIDMLARDPFSIDAKQAVYIDAETSLPIYRVVWEQDGRLRKIVIGILGVVPTKGGTTTGWRGEVILTPASSSRSVLTLQDFETCSRLLPGRALIDFDPSSLGSKASKNTQPTVKNVPTPVFEAEQVDE